VSDLSQLPYRPNVAFVLIDENGKIFFVIFRSMPDPDAGWQMPQGGIDAGESPTDALWREMQEEVGTRKAEIIAAYPHTVTYDFPPDMQGGIYHGKYRGQTQHWFLLRFLGEDEDINIHQAPHADDPEFSDYAWKTPEQVLSLAVPFKRDIYEAVLGYFNEFIPNCAV